jgi:hypothetical protein
MSYLSDLAKTATGAQRQEVYDMMQTEMDRNQAGQIGNPHAEVGPPTAQRQAQNITYQMQQLAQPQANVVSAPLGVATASATPQLETKSNYRLPYDYAPTEIDSMNARLREIASRGAMPDQVPLPEQRRRPTTTAAERFLGMTKPAIYGEGTHPYSGKF